MSARPPRFDLLLLGLSLSLISCRSVPVAGGLVADRSEGSIRTGHVALSVRDLDESVRWYGEAFGLQAVGPVYDVEAGEGPLGRVASALFGPELTRLRIVQLQSPEGLALELFEFVEPVPPEPPGRPQTGLLHLALVVSDYEAVTLRMERMGAQRIASNEGNPNRRTAFFADPDGNVIEIASRGWGE